MYGVFWGNIWRKQDFQKKRGGVGGGGEKPACRSLDTKPTRSKKPYTHTKGGLPAKRLPVGKKKKKVSKKGKFTDLERSNDGRSAEGETRKNSGRKRQQPIPVMESR